MKGPEESGRGGGDNRFGQLLRDIRSLLEERIRNTYLLERKMWTKVCLCVEHRKNLKLLKC